MSDFHRFHVTYWYKQLEKFCPYCVRYVLHRLTFWIKFLFPMSYRSTFGERSYVGLIWWFRDGRLLMTSSCGWIRFLVECRKRRWLKLLFLQFGIFGDSEMILCLAIRFLKEMRFLKMLLTFRLIGLFLETLLIDLITLIQLCLCNFVIFC